MTAHTIDVFLYIQCYICRKAYMVLASTQFKYDSTAQQTERSSTCAWLIWHSWKWFIPINETLFGTSQRSKRDSPSPGSAWWPRRNDQLHPPTMRAAIQNQRPVYSLVLLCRRSTDYEKDHRQRKYMQRFCEPRICTSRGSLFLETDTRRWEFAHVGRSDLYQPDGFGREVPSSGIYAGNIWALEPSPGLSIDKRWFGAWDKMASTACWRRAGLWQERGFSKSSWSLPKRIFCTVVNI